MSDAKMSIRNVADIKARGATAVICSPIPRKSWGEDGKIRRSQNEYAGWAGQVARQQKRPRIAWAGFWLMVIGAVATVMRERGMLT